MTLDCSQIYFDYMATTPVDQKVIEAMLPYLGRQGTFGNPSSVSHQYGLRAAQAVEHAREQIASLVNAPFESIVFTSGATESNNLAILGAAKFYSRKGKHIITMQTEHKAVLDAFHALELEGFEVSYLPPQENGLLDICTLKQAIRKETILVSVMHVNNEIGVIQDIQKIGSHLQNKGIIFHVDAAQSMGRVDIDLAQLPVHLMSFSAHKAYGPKGVGALYIQQSPRIRISPQSFGGGQEYGVRAGTLATHQILGMAKAFELAEQAKLEECERLSRFQSRVIKAINHHPSTRINGSIEQRIPHNLNITFEGYSQSDLQIAFSEFAISSTSACASKVHGASHVLQAIGLSVANAQSSVRISFGRWTTEKEIQRLIEVISDI